MTAAAGVLPVDKPVGPTSHDVVASARKALGLRRIGHTGTLDPFASGLLLLCVGPATRLAEFLTGLDKTYEATACLGIATDTEDREGEVVETRDGWQEMSWEGVEKALAAFSGDIEQVPPQFSAKKVGGEAMHRKARRGEYVPLPPRPVTIHEIELLDVSLPELRFRVRCSSGTYVRSLARDVGEALGVGAHLTHLRRTAVGNFAVDGAVSPDSMSDASQVASAWIDPLPALAHMPMVEVSAEGAADLRHGRRIHLPEREASGADLVAVGHNGELVAVAEVADGTVRPRKVFAHD